ncbi:ATP-binding cassette domain-containing protein [Rhodovulum tesquicola]|uniref:thiamine ABC transporter ATP-binding protein n=1 Tax=Rhodovulum tesquicola TaxID=540254 RepID=UPI0020973A55|nr:ATP-binding cassette domain-containing protein [Rhodovulum tesquicola]MCO8144721.1 ATP-binding cassette domain-containing protein [Rhodovulum tesquicola]
MLRLERLEIRQGAFRLSADVTVEPGRIVALLGPSGAGKSTLLDVIAGFLPPTSGRVLWNGTDLGPLAPGARPLSMLFQDNNLFPHLTAAQNVGLGLRPDLRLSTDQRGAVDAALARVGLEGLGARKPAELSGGQRGRVALARILLRGRPLMLLDEPFAALGPALKTEMLGLVRDLARETGATVLLVTHDPADARAIADETMLVADGIAHPPHPTAALLADPPAALRAYLG